MAQGTVPRQIVSKPSAASKGWTLPRDVMLFWSASMEKEWQMSEPENAKRYFDEKMISQQRLGIAMKETVLFFRQNVCEVAMICPDY